MVLCFRFVFIRKSYLLVIYATILHVLIAYFIDVRCCCSHEMYSEKPGLYLFVARGRLLLLAGVGRRITEKIHVNKEWKVMREQTQENEAEGAAGAEPLHQESA